MMIEPTRGPSRGPTGGSGQSRALPVISVIHRWFEPISATCEPGDAQEVRARHERILDALADAWDAGWDERAACYNNPNSPWRNNPFRSNPPATAAPSARSQPET